MKKPPRSAARGLRSLAGFVNAGGSADIVGMDEYQMNAAERKRWADMQHAVEWIFNNIPDEKREGE